MNSREPDGKKGKGALIGKSIKVRMGTKSRIICGRRNLYNEQLQTNATCYGNNHDTLQGYDDYIVNTVMKNHTQCLKRFLGMYKKPSEEFPDICPFAYAYVFWKDSFYNINPFH